VTCPSACRADNSTKSLDLLWTSFRVYRLSGCLRTCIEVSAGLTHHSSLCIPGSINLRVGALPSRFLNQDNVPFDEDCMACDFVINWAAEDPVLSFIHAIHGTPFLPCCCSQIGSRSIHCAGMTPKDHGNDEHHRIHWTKWGSTPYMHSTVRPTPPPLHPMPAS